jgi:ABC-type dipeptide/oligopeptide/nickel transport system permease subunit
MSETTDQSRAWRHLRRSRSARLGAALIGLCLVGAIFAPALAPYGPNEKTSAGPLAPPSDAHWLGTDADGYDVLSRVLYGGRLSLLAGGASIALAVMVGVTAGVVAGYAGGWIDAAIMRANDLLLSFPGILVAILVVLASDPTSWTPIMVAVGLINIPVFARQVRATVLTTRSLDYVAASEAMGASSPHMLRRVILPAVVSPVIVLATLGLGTAVLEVAGLSFLGIAGQPDDPDWGTMLAVAKNFLAVSFWPALAPGAAISLTVLGFNLLGDGLRDALDPRLR